MYSYGSYYPSSYYDSAVVGAAGAVFTIIGIVFLFVAVLYVLLVVAQWKMFDKAGEAGWKSLIPIYNMVILYKIAGVCPWLILVNLTGAIPVVGPLVILGMNIYVNYKLSKAFGKEGAFTVGLVLLPFIFYLILAFDKSQYVGPKYTSNNAQQPQYNPNMNNPQQYGNMYNQPQYNGNMNNQPQYNGNMNNDQQYNNNMNTQPQFNNNMNNQMPNNNMNNSVSNDNSMNNTTDTNYNSDSNNNPNV